MKIWTTILIAWARVSVVESDAGCPGSIDSRFDAGLGMYSPFNQGPSPHFLPTSRLCGTNLVAGAGLWGCETMRSLTMQPDGKVIVAGSFSKIRGIDRDALARLNGDGTLDTNFVPALAGAADRRVRAVALQSDGKVLIAGNFTLVDGQRCPGLARLNTDGSLDASFVPKATNLIESHALTIFSDSGKIVVSGDFQTDGAESVRGLVRLLPTGELDNTFAPAVPMNVPSDEDTPCPDREGGYSSPQPLRRPLFSLVALNDGKLLVDGLARLNEDGSYDPSYAPEVPDLFEVASVLVQPDGKIVLAGGVVTHSNPDELRVLTHAVIRLQATGARDPDFSAPTVSYPTNEAFTATLGPRSMLLQPDGRIVVGGLFTHVNEQPCGEVFRLHSNGSVDANFAMHFLVHGGYDYEEVETVTALALSPEGRLLAGGLFRVVNGQARSNLVQVFTGIDPRPYRLEVASLAGAVNANFRLRMEVPAHGDFSVQASSNLVNWTTLTNRIGHGTNALMEFEDPQAGTFPRRFYRIGSPDCGP